MNFKDAVKRVKAERVAVVPVDIPKQVSDTELSTETETPVSDPEPQQVLTQSDIPAGMPLTNRLDKMTRAQAVWAIQNGDAWLAYLKANGGESFPPA